MNQQGSDKKRNVKSNGTTGLRNQRSGHQGGGGKASSDRTSGSDKGPGHTNSATNSAPPTAALGPRGVNATTGAANSNISNSNNNNNSSSSNQNSNTSSTCSSTNSNDTSGGGGGAATRNTDAGSGRDRGSDGLVAPTVAAVQQQTAGSAALGASGVPSANSIGSGSARDTAYVSITAGQGSAHAPEGVYNNARFVHAVAALVGHTVEVRVRGEKDTYEGLFHTISQELEIALDCVLVGSPDRERSSPDGRGESPLDSTAAAQSAPGHLAGLVRNMERLKNGDTSYQPLQETMVFSLQDVISVTAYNIDMDYATKDVNAFTDAAILRGANGRSAEKNLQAWMDDDEGKAIEVGQLEDMSATTSWAPEEMFKTNKSKFGVETTYRENLEGYTYQYQQRNDDPEFQRREAEAVRIAMEIESTVQHKRNNDLEIGCDGDDEELKYSAVVKEPRNDSRGSYAHPGGRRNKQSAPNANGGQTKGGSQQRGGTSHTSHHNNTSAGNPNPRGGHTRSTNSPPTHSPAPHVPLPPHSQGTLSTACGGPSRPSPPMKDEGRRGPNERSSPARTSPPPKVQPTQQQQQQQQQQQDKLQQEKQREEKGHLPAAVAHSSSPPHVSTQQQPTHAPQQQQQQQQPLHVSAPVHAVHEGKRTPPLSIATSSPAPVSSQPPAGQQQQPLQPAGQQPPTAGVPAAPSAADAVKADSAAPIQQPRQTTSPAPASQTTTTTTTVSTSTEEIVKKSTLNPNAAEFVFNPKTVHVSHTTVTHNKQNTPPASMMHTGGHPVANRQTPIMVPQHLILSGSSVFQQYATPQPGHGPPLHGHGGAHQPGGAGGHQGGRSQFGNRNKGGNRQAGDPSAMHVTGAPIVTSTPTGQGQQVVLGYPPPHYGPTPPGVPPVTVMQPQIAMQHGQQVQVVNYNSLVQARGVMSPPAGPGVGGLSSPSMVGPIHQGEYPAALHISHPQQVFIRDQSAQLLYQNFDGTPGQALAFVVQQQPPGGGGQSGAPTPPTGGPHGGPHGQQPLLAYPGQPQWGQPMLLMSPINASGGAPTGTPPPPHHAPHMNMTVMPGPPPLGPPHNGPHTPHAPPFAPQTVVSAGPPVPVPPNAMAIPPGVSQVVGGVGTPGGPPSGAVAGAPTGPNNQAQSAASAGGQQGPPPLAAPQQPPPQQPQGV